MSPNGVAPGWRRKGVSPDAHAVPSPSDAAEPVPGPTFGVGTTQTIMKVPAMGSAWDVDRKSGRMVVTEPVVAAGVRMVVMQHWLEQFRRSPSAKR